MKEVLDVPAKTFSSSVCDNLASSVYTCVYAWVVHLQTVLLQ